MTWSACNSIRIFCSPILIICNFADNYHQISYHHDYDTSHETYFTLFLPNNNVILFKFTKQREDNDDDDVCVWERERESEREREREMMFRTYKNTVTIIRLWFRLNFI